MARFNQYDESKLKINSRGRALLEADVLSLWRQFEDNKSNLVRPYSTAFSAILLPFLFYHILIKAKFFESLRFELGKKNLESFFEKKDNNVIQGRQLIIQFENDLQKMAQGLPKAEYSNAVLILKSVGFPQAKLENFVSILMSLPFHLADLTAINLTNAPHLMYFIAAMIDHMYKFVKIPALHNRFHEVLLTILELVPRPLTAQEQKSIPEYQGWLKPLNISPGTTSCLRYAELIHIFFHQYVIGNILINLNTLPYIMKRLGIQFFVLSIGTAIFFDFIAIGPLLKYLSDSPRLHHFLQIKILKSLKIDRIVKLFLPINWYLERPLTLKKYHFLEAKDLFAEKALLEQALKTQAPLVVRTNTVNKFLILLFCLYYLIQFFGNEWSDSALAVIPILAGIILKNLITFSIDKYHSYQASHHLNALEDKIKNVFSIVIPQCKIKKIKYRQIDISYLTIEATQPHQNLSPRHVATVIKAVLNHYGVYLRSHDATSIAIDANTNFSDVEAAKKFFENVLHRSRVHHQLDLQLKNLISYLRAFDHTAGYEPFFSPQTFEFRFIIFAQSITIEQLRNKLGFIKDVSIVDNQIILERNKELSPTEIKSVLQIFAALHQKLSFAEQIPVKKPVAKKTAKTPNTDIKLNNIQSSLPIVAESIDWGGELRFPQNPKIQPLENSRNRFILWDLPVSEFMDEKTYHVFKKHSTRFAYAGEDVQGVKPGAYLGRNYHNQGRQEILPARIKVLGKLKMFGVLLSKKKSSNGGAILYRTCDFTRVH